MPKLGEQFLHQKDSKLHTSQPVEHEQARRKRSGQETSQKPADKLVSFMEVLEKTHLGHQDDPRVLERLKDSYHKEHIIDEEDIPESYYDNQARLAREQGHGDIEITSEMKEQLSEVIKSDQASTMDKWLDYFMSEDSDSYPMWAKYWAFTNMTKLASYDKAKHAFAKRNKNTVAPFPDLNREALAYVVDAVIKKTGKENIPQEDNDPEFAKLLQGANFAKLYAHAIENITPTEENELLNTAGEWIKYNQSSDHMPLVESLQGHGTGWCTAGESTAEAQLKNGDFYVYYSYDQDGQPTIPRSAIRMENNQIAEVRGIAPDQNLDPYIGDVVDEKLEKFPDGEQYKKKTADMKRLTDIDNRYQSGEELSKEDLIFLYEVDSKIEGFGYEKDPRIQDIINTREIKTDLSLVTSYPQEQISIDRERALSGNIKFHYGSLNLNGFKATDGLKLPENMSGDLWLNGLTSTEGLRLPESVGGELDLKNLTSTEGLKLPDSIGGDLDLSSLTSAEGLVLPDTIGGDLWLNGLTSAEGLKLPKTVNDGLSLNSLTSAEGLKLPDSIGSFIALNSLTSAKDLELPKTVNGGLSLNSLTSAEGLKLPETIGHSLDLSSLRSAEGLVLPDSIGGDLDLSRLLLAQGVEFPNRVNGNIDIGFLSSSDDFKLPDYVGGIVYVRASLKQEFREKYPNLYIK